MIKDEKHEDRLERVPLIDVLPNFPFRRVT